MNRDKSIDKPMKPRRREPQRSRRGDSGGNTGDHQNPVLGLCRFVLGVIFFHSKLVNVQPFVVGYRFGSVAVAHNGSPDKEPIEAALMHMMIRTNSRQEMDYPCLKGKDEFQARDRLPMFKGCIVAEGIGRAPCKDDMEGNYNQGTPILQHQPKRAINYDFSACSSDISGELQRLATSSASCNALRHSHHWNAFADLCAENGNENFEAERDMRASELGIGGREQKLHQGFRSDTALGFASSERFEQREEGRADDPL
ncbi:Amidophosphoribosyltransferase protein [Vigna angularis]|uniref:Amidophosphoribosyltransferase protein n=1 Tax=Phaseolus angularis TaxID=3914 RepID=A0A8T0LB65_PHAAN|nr:Amidophosphoribosyltransferase protein [Vigna angularis]